MIIGAHSILFTTDAEADRAFLRDVIKLPHIDAGEGWLIFAVPPAELGVHPSDRNDVHEFYLMCDNVERFVAEMTQKSAACTPIQDQGWGIVTNVTMPSGSKLAVYQPRHARPAPMLPAPTASAVKKARPKAKPKAKPKATKSKPRKPVPKKKARRR